MIAGSLESTSETVCACRRLAASANSNVKTACQNRPCSSFELQTTSDSVSGPLIFGFSISLMFIFPTSTQTAAGESSQAGASLDMKPEVTLLIGNLTGQKVVTAINDYPIGEGRPRCAGTKPRTSFDQQAI